MGYSFGMTPVIGTLNRNTDRDIEVAELTMRGLRPAAKTISLQSTRLAFRARSGPEAAMTDVQQRWFNRAAMSRSGSPRSVRHPAKKELMPCSIPPLPPLCGCCCCFGFVFFFFLLLLSF